MNTVRYAGLTAAVALSVVLIVTLLAQARPPRPLLAPGAASTPTAPAEVQALPWPTPGPAWTLDELFNYLTGPIPDHTVALHGLWPPGESSARPASFICWDYRLDLNLGTRSFVCGPRPGTDQVFSVSVAQMQTILDFHWNVILLDVLLPEGTP